MVLAMAEAGDRRAFRLGWSAWRRAHQALAARCRAARRGPAGDKPPVHPTALPDGVLASDGAALTDAEWESVLPLLPPQRPQIGRPRHDHHVILSGIVWMVRTDASWREMPEEFGKWETVYRRYRLWLDQGLWQRIATTLGIEDAMPNPN